MPRATLPSGITLEYATSGDPAHPTLLLVNGFTSQMTSWDDALIEAFVDQGLHVVRYDNRDVGLSTHLDGVPARLGELQRAVRDHADRPEVAYTLSEMAADGIGLLDHLGVAQAHIAGMSMGGMIVQAMAIEHPTRIASLTSIMSTTGERQYGQATPAAQAALLSAPPAERDAYIDWSVAGSVLWSSKRWFDADAARHKAAAAYDRCYYPEGAARQMAAIIASGNRRDALAALTVPTLVIHGLDDTLIAPDGGRRTAELIPGANLLELADMGHDLPAPLFPLYAGVIGGLAHMTTRG